MKKLIYCLVAIVLIACNDKKGDDYVVQPGTYAFKQSEQIVYVTPTTESFRLEAYYVSEPDDASRGRFMIGINEEKSSPNYASHFPVVPRGYISMTEDENGTFYSDVNIYPESITEEVVLTLYMMCGYEEGAVGFDGNAPINETTIILRPDEVEGKWDPIELDKYELSFTSEGGEDRVTSLNYDFLWLADDVQDGEWYRASIPNEGNTLVVTVDPNDSAEPREAKIGLTVGDVFIDVKVYQAGKAGDTTEVSYTEYSLSGTSCEWNFTKEDSDIIVVNSREELEKYIVCDGECTAPSVDFEKHSLVIAHGGCTNGIHQIGVSKFVKFADEKYGLYIDIVMGWTDAPELWTKALLVEKWDKLYTINLNVDVRYL